MFECQQSEPAATLRQQREGQEVCSPTWHKLELKAQKRLLKWDQEEDVCQQQNENNIRNKVRKVVRNKKNIPGNILCKLQFDSGGGSEKFTSMVVSIFLFLFSSV